MKVWILTRLADGEIDEAETLGAYSTKELALQARDAVEAPRKFTSPENFFER